jgi:hypothetical protein
MMTAGANGREHPPRRNGLIVAMKTNWIALALIAFGTSPLAQDATGRYTGSEKLTVSRCGSYDGVSTRDWRVDLEVLADKGIRLKGVVGDGSAFSGEGTLADGSLSAQVRGVNRYNNAWSGQLEARLDGDRLVGTNAGSLQDNPCSFVSEFDARRSP